MKHTREEITLKDGRVVVLRNPELSDAKALIEYVQQTAYDTKFLISEPEENNFTMEDEEAFIRSRIEADNAVMIAAFDGDKAIGNCHISGHGKIRTKHRCDLGIAILKDYWSSGLGTAMMERLCKYAEELGFHQIELEVIANNEKAIGLYKKFGFVEYGRRPRDLRYKDGSYADAVCMVKLLDRP